LKHDDVCTKLGRTTKIRQNFFPSLFLSLLSEQQKFGRIFLCLRLVHHSQHAFRLFMVQPVSLSLSSSVSAFVSSRQSIIFGSTRPRFIRLRSYASRVLFLPSIHPSISSCCFDLSSTTVSLFVLGPLGCAVYPMLTVGLTCTQLSRPFSGCATYPMLVVGVTCTLSSRSFIQSVLLRPGQVQCFDLLRCRVSATLRAPSLSCQSATGHLRLRLCLHGIAIVFLFFHHRIPAVVRSPDLWLLFGFSVSSLVSVSVICSVSRHQPSSFPAQPGFPSASPFILISAFFLRFRYPVSLQPNLLLRS
jgi:hypothetical protein